jgi:NTP pyrophosphatase (non-canonical NTP hydrolase)
MDIGISNNYAKLCLLKWTSDSQIIKFIEETSELNQKLAKYLLYKDNLDWKGVDYNLLEKIQNEIADVIITLSTLIEIFDRDNKKHNNISKISERITFKLMRLMDRLKQ